MRVIEEEAGESSMKVPSTGGGLPIHDLQAVLGATVMVVPTVNYDNNLHAANENLRLQNLRDGIDPYGSLLARLEATGDEAAQPVRPTACALTKRANPGNRRDDRADHRHADLGQDRQTVPSRAYQRSP